MGSFRDYRKVLSSGARVLGGNLPARYGGWLLGQFAQKQDVSLHAHWAAIPDRRDTVTFAEPDTRQAYPDLDGRYRWNRNSVFAGMAVCPKVICGIQFLIVSPPATSGEAWVAKIQSRAGDDRERRLPFRSLPPDHSDRIALLRKLEIAAAVAGELESLLGLVRPGSARSAYAFVQSQADQRRARLPQRAGEGIISIALLRRG